MITRVHKWGNSLALRIPKAFAQEAQLENDSEVEVLLEDGQLLIRLLVPNKSELNQLLSGVTADNLHGETETGGAVGKETTINTASTIGNYKNR